MKRILKIKKSQFFFLLTPRPRPRNRNSFAASGILVYIKQLVSNERRETRTHTEIRRSGVECGCTRPSTASLLLYFFLFVTVTSRWVSFHQHDIPIVASVAVPAGGRKNGLLHYFFSAISSVFFLVNWFLTERKSHLISILFELKMSMMPIHGFSYPISRVHNYPRPVFIWSLCDTSLMTDETENQVNKWTENDSKDFCAALSRRWKVSASHAVRQQYILCVEKHREGQRRGHIELKTLRLERFHFFES